jgi:hypothetical protein
MPAAVVILPETPRNGQIPKKLASTILLTKTVPMMMIMYSIVCGFYG